MFPSVQFFERVWERLEVILFKMSVGIHQWNHLDLDFYLLGDFWLLIQNSNSLLVRSDCLFLHDLVWVGYIFLGIYLFLPSYPICWCIIFHTGLLQSYVFMWCQLWCLLIHLQFCLFETSFFLVSLTKSLSVLSLKKY